jgi:LuxR family maltose regulon positive regulatory protein
VDGPLTIISAPAGSGKTTLLSSWVAADRSPGSVLWVGLDEEDARPGVFWSYLVAGLAREGLRMPDAEAPTLLDSVDRTLLVRLAASLFDRTEPLVVILDNAEVLAGSTVPSQLNYLLDHAGPQLRLIVAGRAGLALPVHRYRLAATLAEIGFGDLAFTGAEVDDLLAAHGIHLPREAVEASVEMTRGWAAGLVLAASVSRGIAEAGRARGAAVSAPRAISEYFLAEILGVQPPGVQDFLIRTSVVRRMWPDLAVALTGCRDAACLLADLARGNSLLVTGGGDPPWYEHPPLIRDLLYLKLRERAPDSVDQLHRRAACWFAAEGMLTEAIDHALAAGDWRYAATLVVECRGIGRLLGPSGDGLVDRFTAIPADVTGPQPAIVKAAVALAGQDGQDGRDGQDIDGTLSATAAAQVILTDARSRPGRVCAEDLRALLLAATGSALIRAGELERAGGMLTEGLQAAEEAGRDDLRARCLGELALIAVLRGELHRAARFARKADAVADGCRWPVSDRLPAAAVVLSWVHAEAYQPEAARRHADRAAGCRAIDREPVPAGLLALVRARLLRACGDLDGAVIVLEQLPSCPPGTTLPQWLRDLLLSASVVARLAGGAPDVDEAPLREAASRCAHCAVALAATRLAAGQSVEAVQLGNDTLSRTDLPWDLRVEGWLLVCDGELLRERKGPARAALERALALAAPQTLRRPFHEASPRLRGFLRRERDLVGQHPWLAAVEVAAPVPGALAAAGTACTGFVEPLTERESEVLLHLAMLLSTDEIAQTMFISVNTVKTHIRGIFRKLAVSRRNEAIRRARDLGLV